MGISGAAGNLSEESKKALQSETRKAVKEEMKEERAVMHFTAGLSAGTDNAYGWTRAQIVKEYLRSGYNAADRSPDIVVLGVTYKTLKRPEVTVFYDAAGNTLFDVTNERLEKEFEWFVNNGTWTDPGHEESAEDNGDVGKDDAADQKGADREAGGVPPEELTEGEKEADPGGETDQSGSVEDMPEDAGEKEAGKKGKPAGYSGIDGAVAKLQEELKGAKLKEFAEPVIEYLTERCRESESLAADICQTHKTWNKCYDHIVANARKKLNNVSGPVRSDTVFEWAEDYYHKDDKAEEKMKAREAAERKKKEEERKKKAAEKKPLASQEAGTYAKKEKAADKPAEPKPKKNSKDMDGQLDMFSMMGM